MVDNPYRDSLEMRVLSASPLELVVMLYDAALENIRTARACLESGEIRRRSLAVSKAVAILMELRRSLNFSVDMELTTRLASVYDFARNSLLESNYKQARGGLDEAERVLLPLREAWVTITRKPATDAEHRTSAPVWETGTESARARVWSA